MVVLTLVVGAVASCGGHLRSIGTGLNDVREMIEKIDCHDGAPARILIDAHCQDGICGVTCAPNRWTTNPGTERTRP